MNTLKTGILMVVLTALFVAVGYTFYGENGMVLFFGFAALLNFGSYFFSDKIVLRMYKARELTPAESPDIYRIVERLSQRGGIPMPRIYLVNDPQPNAFATGRDPKHAAIAVNTGLLQILNTAEVEGVIAHELSHVKHRDTLTMAVVATTAGAIMMMSRWILWFGGGGRRRGAHPLALLATWLLAPLAAIVIQCLVSQAREYEADAGAARLVGTPEGLIEALGKLNSGVMVCPSRFATQSTAHMMIMNPFGGVVGSTLGNLFKTHPPVEKRIAALRELAPLAGAGKNPWS